jgi:DNA-binding IclR family transcriptional regulator
MTEMGPVRDRQLLIGLSWRADEFAQIGAPSFKPKADVAAIISAIALSYRLKERPPRTAHKTQLARFVCLSMP